MNNELMIFEGNRVEILEVNGVVYFNPYHVGECLELSKSTVRNHLAKMNSNQAVLLKNSTVLLKDSRKLHSTGEKFLTESGVYKLVFKSEKPDAERFTDWITDEVLPAIRKKGAYISANADPEKLRTKADEIERMVVLNDTARILLPVFDEAGLKPQYKALALKQIYRRAGIDLPIEEMKIDREIYDMQSMAKEVVSFERHGHMGTTVQYTCSVIEKAKQWLAEKQYPLEIMYNGKTFKVVYAEEWLKC